MFTTIDLEKKEKDIYVGTNFVVSQFICEYFTLQKLSFLFMT